MNRASASAAVVADCRSSSGAMAVRSTRRARAQDGTTTQRLRFSIPSAMACPAFDSG